MWKKYITRSVFVWAAAILLLVAFALMLVSVLLLFRDGGLLEIKSAITASGITGAETITSYTAMHIVARILAFVYSAVIAAGIIITVFRSSTSAAGINLIVGFCRVIHAVSMGLTFALPALFAIKLIIFIVNIYSARYFNYSVYLFFATVFGELVLAALVICVLIWVKKMSSSLIDDLLSIQYSLVFDKPSPYGTSTFSYISIICTGVISAIGAASMSYDVYAASAFALICAANLIMGVFLKLYKSKTELAVYDGKSA